MTHMTVNQAVLPVLGIVPTRAAVAQYINSGALADDAEAMGRGGYVHFGRVELRLLMDFIYGGKPAQREEIKGPLWAY